MNARLRGVIVGAIALTLLIDAAINVATINQQIAVFGYTIGVDGVTVGTITPGFPAQRAGLRHGDVLQYAKLSLVARMNGTLSRAVPSGTTIRFEVLRNGKPRTLVIRSADFAPSAGPFLRSVAMVAGLVFLAIGIALVLLKPNAMTWGFLLWGTSTLIGSQWISFLQESSLPSLLVWSVFWAAIGGLSSGGMLAFVSRFPSAVPQAHLRWLAQAAVPYGLAVSGCVLAQTYFIAFAAVPPPWWLLGMVAYGIPVLSVLISLVALASTLLSHDAARRKVAPVLISIALAAALSAVNAVQEAILIDPRIETVLMFLSSLAQLLIASSVAYGIVKHRVVEVTYVIARTLVFTGLIAAVVGSLIVLNRLLVQGVPIQSLRGFVEVAGAAAIGVTVPRVHSFVGSIVDKYIFVRRHRSHRQLQHAIDAIGEAEDTTAIANLLVQQPVQSLSLSSAAVFARTEDGDYRRIASVGWPRESAKVLNAGDVLALYLDSTPETLTLEDFGDREDFPGANRRPVLALPIVARHRLHAIVLYGAPRTGGNLETDQQTLLERMVRAASFALEGHLHVQELSSLDGARARFIPDEFLQLLGRDSISKIRLGDHVEREMTVLFADIRGFTAISERLAPTESFEFINAYLERVGPLIREYGGFIDKYIGDSIMALFPGEADSALDAALALQREVRSHSAALASQGKPTISIGVGLHTGRAMLGTIGERSRMETTVISDAVNLASRMEGVTKVYGAGIVISAATRQRLRCPERYSLRPLGRIVVKGKNDPVEALEAFGGDASDVAACKRSRLDAYGAALAQFEAGRWEEARDRFAALAAENAGDGAAHHFARRCEALLSAGSVEWDGIERLQTK